MTLSPIASTLRVYNSRTRREEPFTTIEPGKVGMYVCGVTVYDSAHIGHGMSSIVFDTIRRYLLHLGYDVRYAQNFTDIEDKIIARAQQEQLDPQELTERLIAEWFEEISALGILPATINPRATEEIPEIIAMIEGLIEKGHAYEFQGDVYFRVRSFPAYGHLSGRNLDELEVGVRIGVNEYKTDPLDFALWKASKPGEPQWDSPWGPGRPGWHIECSAMCTHHLNGIVDIHGGGRDLIFPHHENEIAQSEAFSGEHPFAQFWLHNGMLQLNGEKMSKSLGNVVSLRSILDRGMAEAFRIQVLQTHYRAPLNFTEPGLQAAASGLDRLRAAAEAAPVRLDQPDQALAREIAAARSAVESRFHEAMNADFNTPMALASLFDLAKHINRLRTSIGGSLEWNEAQTMLVELSSVLGINLATPAAKPAANSDGDELVDLLVEVRQLLREARAWELSDHIRDRLDALGITITDSAHESTWKRR